VAEDGWDETGRSELDRRAFLKKMAAIAFVAPVISSFTLDAAASADPERDQFRANQFHPNQFRPNQYEPNQYTPNQYAPNLFDPNMFHPNMKHAHGVV
jgi:hypothetical protein